MKDQAFRLESGAELVVTPAPFQDANALRMAVMRAVRGMRLDGQMLQAEMDLQGALQSPALLTELVDKVLAVATSSEVEAALFACGQRAAWNKIKVTPELFDDQEKGQAAREDFYPIMARILEVNVKPFFKRALSGLSGLVAPGATSSDSRK